MTSIVVIIQIIVIIVTITFIIPIVVMPRPQPPRCGGRCEAGLTRGGGEGSLTAHHPP